MKDPLLPIIINVLITLPAFIDLIHAEYFVFFNLRIIVCSLRDRLEKSVVQIEQNNARTEEFRKKAEQATARIEEYKKQSEQDAGLLNEHKQQYAKLKSEMEEDKKRHRLELIAMQADREYQEKKLNALITVLEQQSANPYFSNASQGSANIFKSPVMDVNNQVVSFAQQSYPMTNPALYGSQVFQPPTPQGLTINPSLTTTVVKGGGSLTTTEVNNQGSLLVNQGTKINI